MVAVWRHVICILIHRLVFDLNAAPPLSRSTRSDPAKCCGRPANYWRPGPPSTSPSPLWVVDEVVAQWLDVRGNREAWVGSFGTRCDCCLVGTTGAGEMYPFPPGCFRHQKGEERGEGGGISMACLAIRHRFNVPFWGGHPYGDLMATSLNLRR